MEGKVGKEEPTLPVAVLVAALTVVVEAMEGTGVAVLMCLCSPRAQ